VVTVSILLFGLSCDLSPSPEISLNFILKFTFFGILKMRALFKMHKVCSFLQGPLMVRKNRQTRAQLQNSSYRAIQSRTRSVNTVRVVY